MVSLRNVDRQGRQSLRQNYESRRLHCIAASTSPIHDSERRRDRY